MTTFGGGWMVVASIPSTGNMFAGDTGTGAWQGKIFSRGTYSTSGVVGDYWLDWSKMAACHVMFKTGSGTYWTAVKLTDMVQAVNNSAVTVDAVGSSGNMGTAVKNTKVTIKWDSTPNAAHPIVAAGDAIPGTNDAQSYAMWAENNDATLNAFKNSQGGIILLVRGRLRAINAVTRPVRRTRANRHSN